MRMALAKVSFLPFGLMIDRWRWGVFDGSIKPDHYNKAWWELKAKYQGVAPATPRGEDFFDPGAKYHVPGNTPYTRYFLSHVLQFQFYKGLCDAAGYKGPLYECSFYGNKAAGQKFWAMLSKGASQPWQKTMKELTGGEQMDASAVLEYFAPLQDWLKQQNDAQSSGGNIAGEASVGDTVTITGVDTGFRRELKIDKDGKYQVRRVPTGDYMVVLVHKDGSIDPAQAVTVRVGSTARVMAPK
jgi:peptidyl-dipeptidase A